MFRNVLDDCGLSDLGFSGPKFTWCNGRETQHRISERIDRFLASVGWSNMFPTSRVKHGIVARSDHLPIMLMPNDDVVSRIGKKLFRFEAMWTEHVDCEHVISDSWSFDSGGEDMQRVMRKISRCSEKLQGWNNNSFGKVHLNIKKTRLKLQQLHTNDPIFQNHELQKEA